MWNVMQKLFRLKQFENQEEWRRALLLTITLSIIALVSILDSIVVVNSLYEGRGQSLLILGLAFTLSLSMLIVLYATGRVAVVSLVTGVFFMVVAVINLFTSGGISGFVTDLGILTGMVFASLLLGRRSTIVFTGIAAISFVVAFVAESAGWIQPFSPSENLFSQLAILLFITLFMGSLIYYAQTGLDQALERLERSNADLEIFNQNLEEIVAVRTRDLQVVAEISTQIDQIREMRPMLDKAVNLIRQEFNLYHVQVYLIDPMMRSLVLQASTGRAGAQMLRQNHRLAFGPGSVNGSAAAQRRAVLINDVRQHPNHQPNPLLTETTVELAVPLQIGSRLIGVLDMQDNKEGTLISETVSTFELLAQQLSVAIENAQLFDELEITQQKVIQQAQRLIDREWESYIDHIDSSERLKFTAENSAGEGEGEGSAMGTTDPLAEVPIQLAGVTIGQFALHHPDKKRLSNDEKSFLQAVAEQVAQRVDNLRLLNEASRYRAEAQTALRRMTLEAWQEFGRQDESKIKGFFAQSDSFSPINDEKLSGLNGHQLPLIVRGEEIGELEIDGLEEFADKEMAAEIALSLSRHLENLRLTTETERRAGELAIINRVNDAVRGFVNLEQVYDAVGQELLKAFGASSVYIATYRPGEETFEMPFFITIEDDGEIIYQEVPSQKLGDGLTSSVILQRQPILINAETKEELETMGAISLDPNVHHRQYSFMAVPILSGNDIIGVLSIQDRTGSRFYNSQDQHLLETISTSLGITMQNTRLYQQTQEALEDARRQSRELEAINRVVLATGSANTIDESLQIVADELLASTSADQVGVALIEPDQQKLMIRATSGGDNQEAVLGMTIPIAGNLPTEEVMRTLKPLIIENVRQAPIMEPVRAIMEARHVEAVGLFPIFSRSGIMGTIGLDITEPGKTFSPEEIQLTAAIVRQTATLIESAQLFSETEKRAQRERLINEITQKIQGAATVENALQTTITELGKALNAHYVRVELDRGAKRRQITESTNGGNGKK